MSYTTRCPACGTMFKVVPDQLKISDGWVRCGHCADVFDATLYLEAWVPPPAATPSRPAEPSFEPSSEVPAAPLSAPVSTHAGPDVASADDAPSPGADSTRDVPPAPSGIASSDDGAPTGNAAPPQPSGGARASAGELLSEPDPVVPVQSGDYASRGEWLVPPGATAPSEASPDPQDPAENLSPQVLAQVHVAAAGADDFQAELNRFAEASGRVTSVPVAPGAPGASIETTAATAFLEPEDVVAVHEAGEPGFMRQARRQAFWRSPAVRAALCLVAVVLGLVLVGQWALHERDTLAARHPALAPLLAQLCEPLGCSVGPVQRIDAVVIDSSTLVRRLGNFYAFDVVLKNNADIPLAVPALELSLTDTRDSVMARRVFLPQELPGAPRVLPARSTQPLSLRLSISDLGGVPMAGYRALVFYP